MKLSNPTSFRTIQALIVSQSGFENQILHAIVGKITGDFFQTSEANADL